jgi:predicted negative regulator of RcsB-dependent stress response
VDLIENCTDKTEGLNRVLILWWKFVFRMWDNPKPALEALDTILGWDFDSIIVARGDLIEENAREVARQAWQRPLKSGLDL